MDVILLFHILSFHLVNFRFSPPPSSNFTEQLFNQEKYDRVLLSRLLPICKQSMLQAKAIKRKGKRDNPMMICSEFLPTHSNHGFCLTRNAANLDKVFKPSEHLSTFQDIFYPSNSEHSVKNIQRDLSAHHFTFLVDANSYKDLKRGKEWKTSSNTVFNLGIHSTYDTADIRGWYNQIMSIPTGYITKISIKQVEIRADDTLRSIGKEQRRCRFTEENDDLKSVKSYSKINCLLDCKMEEAEMLCGCRPWDYPTPNRINDSSVSGEMRVCDFYGTSCFNKVLQENVESLCHEKCVPNCDEINYSISIGKEPIDPGNRICSYSGNPTNALEFEIKKYMLSQFVEDNQYGNSTGYIASSPPERRILNLVKGILSKSNDSYYKNEKVAYEKDCGAKLNSDVAAVVVSIDSPTFTRMIKSSKVSFFDKLAILGKYTKMC